MPHKHIIKQPTLVISLDFELMWGVFDKRSIADYGANVRGVHDNIPQMLALFKKYDVHVTWGIVGLLFYESLQELETDLPTEIPLYQDDKFSAYSHVRKIDPENFKMYYSGVSLIEQIRGAVGQEIGTHTFSHYYCLEDGQNHETFRADIKKAIERAKKFGIGMTSIIFPRNQYSAEYLKVCYDEGITAFRGNENNFVQKSRSQKDLNIFIRLIRFADTYVNVLGNKVIKSIEVTTEGMVNVPASFFFRPYDNKFAKIAEYLKIRRYKKAMLTAAKTKSLIHFWWHPHNFGRNQQKNLSQLEELLKYYKFLRQVYGMKSSNMKEIVDEALKQ